MWPSPPLPPKPHSRRGAQGTAAQIADANEARAEEIAFVEAMDTGPAIRFMAQAALREAENFRYFADLSPKARDGQTLHAAGQVNITARTPIGPVGIITPWNTPFMLPT